MDRDADRNACCSFAWVCGSRPWAGPFCEARCTTGRVRGPARLGAPALLLVVAEWAHTQATITRDLEEMQKKGYGGVLLVDANGANQNGNDNVPAGPEFGSPEWTALFVHALREADRLGLEVTLNITSGWNLGGPWVQPKQASKLLTWSRTVLKTGATDAKLELPPMKNGFYQPDCCAGLSFASGQFDCGREWRCSHGTRLFEGEVRRSGDGFLHAGRHCAVDGLFARQKR